MPSIKRQSQGPSPLGPDFPFRAVPRSTESPAGGTGNWFVRSLAVGTGDGRTWLNAFTTLAAAFAAGAAGDTFWVADDHAETQATTMTLTAPGTAASPNRIICVNRAGSVPPSSADLRTSATVSATGIGDINFAGCFYCYGITFSAAGTLQLVAASGSQVHRFEACALRNSTSGNIYIGSTLSGRPSAISLHNTTVQFGSSTGSLGIMNSVFSWTGTASAVTAGTLPTTLITLTGAGVVISLIGVDLSALGAGKTLVGASSGSTPARITLQDCKLGSSVTVSSTPGSQSVGLTDVVRCDSGNTNYRTERYRYEGTLTTETTIVRTGGASDGTTPISWKIVTTANSKRYLPFECFPISIWNETTGSAITITIEGIWGSAWLPTNADLWMEVEYLGSSATPQGSVTTTGAADVLAAGTLLTSSAQTWGGSTTPFSMSATITPNMKGPITVYVKAALASSTFYIDPKITISGVTVSKTEMLGPGVYVNELSAASTGAHIATRQKLGM